MKPYSRTVTFTGTTVPVAGTWLSLGALLTPYIGGTIMRMSYSTWFFAATAYPNAVEFATGNAGAPVTTFTMLHDIQAGAPWFPYVVDFTGPGIEGIQIINAEQYLWVRSTVTGQANVRGFLVIHPPT